MILAVLGVVLHGAVTNDAYSCEDCNLVVVSVEPLRADHVGAYGYERNTTPSIDSMAEESLVFTEAYAQSSHTFTSLLSVFTGLYPSQHGVTPPVAVSQNYSQNFTMMAEALNEKGYKTVAFTEGDNVRPELGVDQGFERYLVDDEEGEGMRSVRYFLESNRDGKFFLYFQRFTTHDPYIADEGYQGIFDPTIESFNRQNMDLKRNLSARKDISPSRKYEMRREYYFSRVKGNVTLERHAIAQYDGMVRESDDMVGDITEMLEEEGLEDNTVVVFTSMHGEMLGEHGQWRHHEHLYNEVLKVPLIVKVPGAPPERYEHPFELIALAPTLLDILGVESSKFDSQAHAKSVKPVLSGEEEPGKRFVFAEGVNLDRRALLDFEKQLKYYSNDITGAIKVYNISGSQEKEVNNSEIRSDMTEIYSRFAEDIVLGNHSVSNVYPYIIE